MSTRLDRLPLSRVNLVLGAMLLVAFVTTLALGLVPEAFVLGLGLVLLAVGIYRARRVLATDVNRVDAIEYLDERDRAMARDGFAVVGVAALVLSLAEFVLMSIFVPDWAWILACQSTLLAVVWVIGNRVAARRH
jgi:cadmium resistance protein CadD (predicted permease)